ncbi:MAG TPA: metallophosphoesterase [Blastocatellia bacterium]|nr:metallophosphoesterase [Blastocatellia bacterium]
MPWSLRMTLMLASVGLVFHFYVARKAIFAIADLTRWPKKYVRSGVILFFLWLVLYPLVLTASYYLGFAGVFRAIQRPGALSDALLVYPFWLGLVLSVQVTFFFLLMDIAGFLISTLYRQQRARWQKIQPWLVIALIGIGVIYVIARVYNDTLTVRTVEREARIANLPQELDGFRIAHIADLQADVRTNGSKLQAYVDAVNRLNPDLILFGGDLVTSGPDFIETGAQAIGKMRAEHGIYACLGDHDHFSDRERVTRSLESNGVNVLDNLAAVVPVGTTHLSLTGITNVYRTRPGNGTLEAIEQQRVKGPVSVMLTHQPSPWLVEYALERGYDLFLAGHTHGGQIVFPLPGFLLTGSSFETPYVTGFYCVGKLLVSVNNGLGLTLAPIRYHAPAEVTLIRLKK